jgi:hypothetical protein
LQSDWDGYIIPHIVTASRSNKVFATLHLIKEETHYDVTVKAVDKRLEHIARNCLIDNPEFVKGFHSSRKSVRLLSKSLLLKLTTYAEAKGIAWNKPS